MRMQSAKKAKRDRERETERARRAVDLGAMVRGSCWLEKVAKAAR